MTAMTHLNKTQLCDQVIDAVKMGEIRRALVARNLSQLRLVYQDNGTEYEVELQAVCQARSRAHPHLATAMVPTPGFSWPV